MQSKHPAHVWVSVWQCACVCVCLCMTVVLLLFLFVSRFLFVFSVLLPIVQLTKLRSFSLSVCVCVSQCVCVCLCMRFLRVCMCAWLCSRRCRCRKKVLNLVEKSETKRVWGLRRRVAVVQQRRTFSFIHLADGAQKSCTDNFFNKIQKAKNKPAHN